MANILVTQTQVDGYDNNALYPELSIKRDDVTGIIQGRFHISNSVHGEGTKFSGEKGIDYDVVQPPARLIHAQDDGNSTTIDRGDIGIIAGDVIIQASHYYQNATPGVASGFTNLHGGKYSSYHGWRYAYRIATAADETGTLTISNGNRANLIAVFRLKGTGTPVLGNWSRTSYTSDITGSIAVPSTHNGVVIAVMLDNTTTNLTGARYTDYEGSLSIPNIKTTPWVQNEQHYTGVRSLLAYREVFAGESVPNQQADFDRNNFNSQIIMHFYRP
jgi:hypothetical protein